MARFSEGDRVTTPDGPGTYIHTYKERDRHGELVDAGLIVQLDADYKGTIWRRVYSGDQVEPEQSDAYELDDPKHPTYRERMADWADAERKREKEHRGS